MAVALIAVLVGCKGQPAGSRAGAIAPDFVLNDIDGKEVHLSDFRGKIVMLEFWATWCPPCRMAIPELNELQAKHKDDDFVLLSISTDEEVSTVKEFTKEFYINYPVLFDDKGVSNDFGAYSIPTAVVIGKDGKVIKHHMGYAPGIMEELVQEALAEDKTKDTAEK